MSYEHKANTGTLFPNTKKTSDIQPDYKGKIKVGEKEYDLAGWLKEGTNCRFISLKISEPFQPSLQNTSEKIANSTGIPF